MARLHEKNLGKIRPKIFAKKLVCVWVWFFKIRSKQQHLKISNIALGVLFNKYWFFYVTLKLPKIVVNTLERILLIKKQSQNFMKSGKIQLSNQIPHMKVPFQTFFCPFSHFHLISLFMFMSSNFPCVYLNYLIFSFQKPVKITNFKINLRP